MSLSSSTLAAIQKAGAAVFVADEKLKQAAQNYADRVSAAIAGNPYHLGNDALIESWKTVARLSQTVATMEAEIKKVFQVAAELTGEDQPVVVTAPAAAAPKRVVKQAAVAPVAKAPVVAGKAKRPGKAKPAAAAPAVAARVDLTPTDVVIKSSKKAAKPKAIVPAAPKKSAKVKKAGDSQAAVATPAKVLAKPKKKAAAPKAKVSSVKPAAVTAAPGELIGNAAKLLQQLELVLNASDFSEVNQTVMAKASGVALGSMTAALKKLMALGRIVADPAGRFKLTPAPQVVATAEAAPGAN